MLSVCCISIGPITHTETADSQITRSQNPNCSSQDDSLSLCVNHELPWHCRKTSLTCCTHSTCYFLYSPLISSHLCHFSTPSPTLHPPHNICYKWQENWVDELPGIWCGRKFNFFTPHSRSLIKSTPSYITHKASLLTNQIWVLGISAVWLGLCHSPWSWANTRMPCWVRLWAMSAYPPQCSPAPWATYTSALMEEEAGDWSGMGIVKGVLVHQFDQKMVIICTFKKVIFQIGE